MEIKINKIDGTIDLGKNVLEGIEVKIPMENCVTCEHFDWWDGDWCCLKKFKILSHSWETGEMRKDLLETIETRETCEDYKEEHSERPGYVEEYTKLIETLKL